MAGGVFAQMIPGITDTLVAIGADIVRAKVRQAVLKSPTVQPLARQETPPRGHVGCPYCAITKNMAIAFRYLMRASERPQWGSIYHELAIDEVRSADSTVLAIPTPDIETLRLAQSVHEFEVWMAHPLASSGDFKQAAARAWSLSDQAIALAERFQSSMRSQEAMISDLDQAVADLATEATAIDGQARVIS